MKLIKFKTYAEMSEYGAKIVQKTVKEKPKCVLGLATGSTPLGLYENLIKKYNNNCIYFGDVKTINLDEYYGIDGKHDQSYRYYMNKNFFDKIGILYANTFVPNGMAENIEKECKEYEDRIDEIGIDLQILGIGNNGHIGFNEPCNHFPSKTHLVDLSESTIRANSRFFANLSDVPTKAITMGIGSIMKAKKIILLATGKKKEIIEKAMYGDVTPEVPASILQFHPNVTVLICEEM